MSPDSALLRAPRFTALLHGLAGGVLPAFNMLDGLYPAAPFLYCGEDTELCLFPENIAGDAADFYTRFRQHGGQRPVLPFAEALPGALAAAQAGGRHLLAAVRSANSAAVATVLEHMQARPPLLVLLPDNFHHALPELTALGYTGCCYLRLVQGEIDENYCFLSTEHSTAALVQAFEAVGRNVADDIWFDTQAGGTTPDSLVLFLTQGYQAWGNVSLSPLRLVHDSGRPAEGDASYSWLWCANQPQLRMLLGPTAGRFRRVRVVVPNAQSTENLRAALLLFNGEVVRPHVEVWAQASGAVSADLPPGLAEPFVLGLWVPQGRIVEDGVTRLFACIDRVELTA